MVSPSFYFSLPERKLSRTAYCGPYCAWTLVMSAMMAVGPMVMSLQLPNTQ